MGKKKGVFETHKRRGEWVEARFLACAAERGFQVTKPWGESSRYDFVLDHNGQFLRVQVKSTICKRQNSAYVCNLRANRSYYTVEAVDFFAVYVVPEDTWYIIPASVGSRVKVPFWLWPRCPERKHKYDCYREAWDLLSAGKAKSKAKAASAGR
jgi:hypothetical protein